MLETRYSCGMPNWRNHRGVSLTTSTRFSLLPLAAAVLAACTGGQGAAVNDATSTPPPLSASQAAQWITFTSFRDGLAGLFSIHPDGSGLTQLTQLEVGATHPDWSPDGSRLAVSLRVDSSNYEIAILGPDGALLDTLTDSESILDTDPDWSPDGSKLAFSSNIDAIAVDFRAGFDIYLIDAAGSRPTMLTHSLDWGIENVVSGTEAHQWNNAPDWSPDGQFLAYQTNGDGNNEIYVMAADGSNPVNVTNDPSNDRYPAWSPDGSRIAFVSDRDGNDEIYLMNPDGTGLTRLTENDSLDAAPAWSSDGNLITFSAKARQGNNPDIYVMRADGSGVTQLTTDPDFDGYPTWKPAP